MVFDFLLNFIKIKVNCGELIPKQIISVHGSANNLDLSDCN